MSGSIGQTPQTDWESLARKAAGSVGEGEESLLLRELLAFQLADTPYAIPVERVREIVRLRPITPMPRVPDPIIGVIALRGEIVQVLDLRKRLALPPTEQTRRSRIIVLHGDDDRVTGVLVDSVREVLRVTEEAMRAASEGDSGSVGELCVREGQFVSILDLDRVLDLGADS
ncbi:MAG: chemotaxis protein CheW [Proteobacteria bacterium]|nr:chemotaxis protein CheW [Pseudomonadota bacterium]